MKYTAWCNRIAINFEKEQCYHRNSLFGLQFFGLRYLRCSSIHQPGTCNLRQHLKEPFVLFLIFPLRSTLMDTSLGTFLHYLWGFYSIHTCPTLFPPIPPPPNPPPTTHLTNSVIRVYPRFFPSFNFV